MVFPEVDPGDGFRNKLPGRFFPGLSDCRFDKRLIRIEVACGLIDYTFTMDNFFDHEKFLLTLYDGGDCSVWFPDHDLIFSDAILLNAC